MQVPKAVNYLATTEGRIKLLEIIFNQAESFTINDLMAFLTDAAMPMDRSLVTTVVRVLVTKGLLLEWSLEDEVKRRGRKTSAFRVAPAAKIAA